MKKPNRSSKQLAAAEVAGLRSRLQSRAGQVLCVAKDWVECDAAILSIKTNDQDRITSIVLAGPAGVALVSSSDFGLAEWPLIWSLVKQKTKGRLVAGWDPSLIYKALADYCVSVFDFPNIHSISYLTNVANGQRITLEKALETRMIQAWSKGSDAYKEAMNAQEMLDSLSSEYYFLSNRIKELQGQYLKRNPEEEED